MACAVRSPLTVVLNRLALNNKCGSFRKKLSTKLFNSTVSHKYRTHMCGEISEREVGKSVKLTGWLEFNRGEQLFTIRDYTGSCQVIQLQPEKLPRINSILLVEGDVVRRPQNMVNKKMKTGEFEVRGRNIACLNESRALPIPLTQKGKLAKEDMRMRYRYLDLRTDGMQKNLRLRSSFILNLRKYLCETARFVEVETPTLFKKTPGGAREFIVPTHFNGKFYTLPQSPQQFKQLLMSGGIDRYMQIAKCYRDEGARPDRQPEFTQLDLEMSYVTPQDIMSLVEDALLHCWPSELTNIQLPFPRMNFNDAILNYGTDKPDTRFQSLLTDVTQELSKVTLFQQMLSNSSINVRACNIPNGANILSNSQIRKLQKDIESLVKLNVATIKVDADRMWRSPLAKFIHTDSTIADVNKKLNAKSGDLIFICAHNDIKKVCEVLGKCRSTAAQVCADNGQPLHSPNEFQFLWIENFPLFDVEDNELVSAHHPFTAPHEDDLALISTQPLQVRGQHYDLVLNGFEVGGGSIRIHDSKLQKYVLEDVLKTDSSSLQHLMEALEYGCPPHGGIALGLDRLLAVMCNSNSIRDVIAFPKSSEGRDLMCNSPCKADEDDLKYYHITSAADADQSMKSSLVSNKNNK